MITHTTSTDRAISSRRYLALVGFVVALSITLVPSLAVADEGSATGEGATIADLRQMVDDFHAAGEVTLAGWGRLGAVLSMAESYDRLGADQQTIRTLELFKTTADDPVRVPSVAARAALIAKADQIIAELGSG